MIDNGPELTGRAFATQVTGMGVTHHRIPPRSPNHNSVCERFYGSVPREFYRPHFHVGASLPPGDVPRKNVARVVAAVLAKSGTIGRFIEFNDGRTPIEEAVVAAS